MGVREFTDEAQRLFDITTDYIADKVSEPIRKIKEKVSSRKVPWMVTAEANLGVEEASGYRNNPTIIGWAKRIGGWMKRNYTADATPWCGLFVAHCMHANGIPITIDNPLGARNWLKFGERVDPCFGSVMVFWRGDRDGWQGHVGFYLSEDEDFYHIVGGNQSNKVSVTKISKSRFLGARWPKGYSTLHEQNKGRRYKEFSGIIFDDND